MNWSDDDLEMLKDIIIYWYNYNFPIYEIIDINIQNIANSEVDNMIIVNFKYLSLGIHYRKWSYPVSIHIHKRDVRNYKINKIIN